MRLPSGGNPSRASNGLPDPVRLEHPDSTGEDSPEANARAAELNEAIAFFPELLGA
jgi:hypothetical protein